MTEILAHQTSGQVLDAPLSLTALLEPTVLANPYSLYRQLRETAPVFWDPYLHYWVLTRYEDVVWALQHWSAQRAFAPQQLAEMGLPHLIPLAEMMTRQMLFQDPPEHGRMRRPASDIFTPHKVARWRQFIQEITDSLIDGVQATGQIEVIADLALPLPAIVTAEMLGVPTSDYGQLKTWAVDYGEVLGNFQNSPDSTRRVLRSLTEMVEYFTAAVRDQQRRSPEGLIAHLIAHADATQQLNEEEIVANTILTMVGGLETTTNLIGNGLLALLRHPEQLALLRRQPDVIESAVEELARYESPSQMTARLAPRDLNLAGVHIQHGQAAMAIMGAANRDPQRFAEPDVLDLRRQDNRHLAYSWGGHYCFGAALARIEGQVALATLLRRLPDLRLATGDLTWRPNLGLRGLAALPLRFGPRNPEGA